MAISVKDVMDLIEGHAPLNLKESYDNVGLMIGDSKSTVSSILVALDCTLDVIEESKEKGCNLIITHHPLLFKKPSSITMDTLLGRKIIELIRNDINLYSSHTNLDSVEGGINDLVSEILGFTKTEVLDPVGLDSNSSKRAGIGRFTILEEPVTLGELCEKTKNMLKVQYIRYSGDEDKKIRKIAIINGSGQNYFAIAAAKGADCIISGDTTYHYISDYSECGIAVIDAGHFSTEWPAMKLFALALGNMLKKNGFENDVIISEKTRDPYKYR